MSLSDKAHPISLYMPQSDCRLECRWLSRRGTVRETREEDSVKNYKRHEISLSLSLVLDSYTCPKCDFMHRRKKTHISNIKIRKQSSGKNDNSPVYSKCLCTHIQVHKQTDRMWTLDRTIQNGQTKESDSENDWRKPHNGMISVVMRQWQHKKIIKFLYGKIINKKLKPTNWMTICLYVLQPDHRAQCKCVVHCHIIMCSTHGWINT